MKRPMLGEFEMLALVAILRLGDEAYGVRIRREIEERCQRSVSIGAMYTTLDRLETKGLVTASLGEPTHARGGRAKRYFRVTPAGERALRRSLAALGNMLDGLELGLEPV